MALRLERKVDEVREVVVGQREAETAAVVAAAAAEASKAALHAEIERLKKEVRQTPAKGEYLGRLTLYKAHPCTYCLLHQ